MANAAGVEMAKLPQPQGGASITLKTVAGDSTVVPFSAQANLDTLREAVFNALKIPKNRQSLLVNNTPLVDGQQLDRVLAQGDGNLTIVVLAKNPSYTKCAQHEAYDEDFFCKTCTKFFCARCAVAHAKTPGHSLVDTTDEVEFFKEFQADIDKHKARFRKRMSDWHQKEQLALKSRQQALEAFLKSHASYLEVVASMGTAKLEENQLKDATTPQQLALWLSSQQVELEEKCESDIHKKSLFDDSDDEDLFGEEREKKVRARPLTKSSILLDVKAWDDTIDLEALCTKIKSNEKDGLLWGAHKIAPVAYGMNKLQLLFVIEDDKVSSDDIEDIIMQYEDEVQSMDIVAWNKV